MLRPRLQRDDAKLARRALIALMAVTAGCGTEARPPEPDPAPAVSGEPAPSAPEEPIAADAGSADARPDASPKPDAGPGSGAKPEPELPMLLDFTRDHCLPCQIMAPWVDELRKQHAGRVLVKEINIDREGNQEIGRFFGAKSIPTQVYVDATGREVKRHVGLATKEQMQRALEKLGFTGKP